MANRRKLERPGLESATGRKKRPLAPRLSVTTYDRSDEREEIMKANIPQGMHGFYGDRQKHNDYLREGYAPVMVNGEQAHHKGDPLYMIEEAKFVERRTKAEMESVDILQSALKSKRSDDSVKDAEGREHRLRDMPD